MTLHSNKIVFRGHPDKVCDQISDAILTEFLKKDQNFNGSIRTIGNENGITITGEIFSDTELIVDIEKIVKNTLNEIGYFQKFNIINQIDFYPLNEFIDDRIPTTIGYATNETENYISLTQSILQSIAKQYDYLVYQYPSYFSPNGDVEIVGYYDEKMKLNKIQTLTVNYYSPEKHKSWSDATITNWIKNICNEHNIQVEKIVANSNRNILSLFREDSGSSNKQIINDYYFDEYLIKDNHFSGESITSPSRIGAYKARNLAIKILKEFDLNWCSVRIIYEDQKPFAIQVKSNNGDIDVDKNILNECSIENIINEFNLSKINYKQTSRYGNFGLGFPWDN